MLTLITACNRHDLLIGTINSLVKNQAHKLDIAINEDSENVCIIPHIAPTIINTYQVGGIGQHKSIELFIKYLSKNPGAKYYLHVEEDWEFENSYDWISESIRIMETDHRIIKVLCASDSPHPINQDNEKSYSYLKPWEDPWNKTTWHGFSWNPGITRIDLLNKFIPFGQWEQDLSKEIYDQGYRVVQLKNGVCKHTGNGRSTH